MEMVVEKKNEKKLKRFKRSKKVKVEHLL